MTKIMNCKLKIIKEVPTLEADAIAEPHLTKIKSMIVEQWFLDLCVELPELKIYDYIDNLYDELGEY